MAKDDSGPAFAAGGEPWQQGMTLRDYFAGKALEGLLAGIGPPAPEETAAEAYRYARAMLRQRTKESTDG